jgi:hypothetical protein
MARLHRKGFTAATQITGIGIVELDDAVQAFFGEVDFGATDIGSGIFGDVQDHVTGDLDYLVARAGSINKFNIVLES